MISILILTRNEENDIEQCLRSCAMCDDVHVFDSHSTDATVAIALRMGAQVHTRVFDNYAAQRNAALDTVAYKYDWVFVLDADERMGEALWREMLAAVAIASPEVGAFSALRLDHFMGRPLRHAPIMRLFPRLLRRGRARYTRAINEMLDVDGQSGTLTNGFDHFSFSKGLEAWFLRSTIATPPWRRPFALSRVICEMRT